MCTKTFYAMVWALIGLASGVGCSDENPGLVSVEGSVTLDGRAMPRVQLIFDRPELSPNENKPYAGKTNDDGRYSLRSLVDDQAGAPPGKYRVSLTTSVAEPPYREDAPLPPERIPRQYRQGKLTFVVPEAGAKDANFHLKSM
jgi:hypothetical protein